VDGRPIMVFVGAHFLLRCLDLERFVLYVVKVSTYHLAHSCVNRYFCFGGLNICLPRVV
jgi:hypothetical protein